MRTDTCVAGFSIHRLRIPLEAPYHLSIGDVRVLETILVEALDVSGRQGFGEATVLTGYTRERPQVAWSAACRLAAEAAAGMAPVLGNGVAADPACWMEACVPRRAVDNAGEMNGFLKIRHRLLRAPPKVEQGALLLAGKAAPGLDRAAVSWHALRSQNFRTA